MMHLRFVRSLWPVMKCVVSKYYRRLVKQSHILLISQNSCVVLLCKDTRCSFVYKSISLIGNQSGRQTQYFSALLLGCAHAREVYKGGSTLTTGSTTDEIPLSLSRSLFPVITSERMGKFDRTCYENLVIVVHRTTVLFYILQSITPSWRL
jgi:hypothetical protein